MADLDPDPDALERLHKRWLNCDFSEDPVCRAMEEALADGLPSLIASARRLAEVEAQRCGTCALGRTPGDERHPWPGEEIARDEVGEPVAANHGFRKWGARP